MRAGIGLWLACHEFEPSTTKDPPCRGAMHVKSVESSNVLPMKKRTTTSLLSTKERKKNPSRNKGRRTREEKVNFRPAPSVDAKSNLTVMIFNQSNKFEVR
ncbi:hypothetical protein TNCV_5059221 [Trichonephila clavipes]|nr:hypothetical protein TNCV_5059221 [Trichonephila clavipes]